MSNRITAFTVCLLWGTFAEAGDPPAKRDEAAGVTVDVTVDDVENIGHPFYILLSSPAIADEIAMTDKQKNLQKKMLAETGASILQLNEEFKRTAEQVPADKRKNLVHEKQEKQRSIFSKYNEQLTDLLTAAQQQRLRQIRLQILRYTVFLNPAFQRHLGMTEEQVAETRKLYNEAGAQAVTVRKKLDQKKLTKPEYLSQGAEIEKTFTRDVLKLLTDEQRKQYETLCGEPMGVDIKSLKFQLDFRKAKPGEKGSNNTP